MTAYVWKCQVFECDKDDSTIEETRHPWTWNFGFRSFQHIFTSVQRLCKPWKLLHLIQYRPDCCTAYWMQYHELPHLKVNLISAVVSSCWYTFCLCSGSQFDKTQFVSSLSFTKICFLEGNSKEKEGRRERNPASECTWKNNCPF